MTQLDRHWLWSVGDPVTRYHGVFADRRTAARRASALCDLLTRTSTVSNSRDSGLGRQSELPAPPDSPTRKDRSA
jgi:hypothetical protein